MTKLKGFIGDAINVHVDINDFLEEHNAELKGMQAVKQSNHLIYVLIAYECKEA